MDSQLEAKLIECLSALEQHESIDQILARYPQDAARLRPMLEVAVALPTLQMTPSEATQAQAREAFLAQASDLRDQRKRRPSARLPRLLSAFAAVALVCVVLGAGVVAASSALPGDPLYGLKRTVESARLALSLGDASRSALAAQFEQTRRDEITALIHAGREAEVEFLGTIEALQPGVWTVSNVNVIIGDTAQISGDPAVGRIAQVHGQTSRDGLLASRITVEPGRPPTPAPTPAPSATPDKRPTPPATESPAPSLTPSATRTPAPPAVTPTPEAVEVEFTGIVQSIDPQAWTFSEGTVVEIAANTQIGDSISVGQQVKVQAFQLPNGRLIARQIERINAGGNGNANQNTNDNQNSNDNQNTNNNDNGNDNQNTNTNDNENHNENSNSNSNENDNSNNSNDNHNDNTNGNSNENDNGNANHNDG